MQSSRVSVMMAFQVTQRKNVSLNICSFHKQLELRPYCVFAADEM